MFEYLAKTIKKAVLMVLTEVVVMAICYVITLTEWKYCDIAVILLMIIGIIRCHKIIKEED